MNLLSFLSGPIGDVFKKVGDTVKQFVTTDKDRLAIEAAVLQAQADFQVKLAELDAQWAGMQRDVIVAEANGHSWLQRNWRPVIMMWLVSILTYIVYTGGKINGNEIEPSMVLRILDIIEVGLGGYVIGRSVEKTAPHIANIFKSIKK